MSAKRRRGATDAVPDRRQTEPIYLTAAHKVIILRFVKGEKDFIAAPERHSELLAVMATELNELNSTTTKTVRDWIVIMNEWIRCVDEDYKAFTNSIDSEINFAPEDEELVNHLQDQLITDGPTAGEINATAKCLESFSDSAKLWAAVADELEDIERPKRSAVHWKRTFCKLLRRLGAKHDLYQHLCLRSSTVDSAYDLTEAEQGFLRAWADFEHRQSAEHVDSKNLRNLCRICLLSSGPKMTRLFDSAPASASLLRKLNFCECLSEEAREDDGYPQYICSSCSALLESAYQLKLICMKTEEQLVKIFGANGLATGDKIEEEEPELIDEPPGKEDEGAEELEYSTETTLKIEVIESERLESSHDEEQGETCEIFPKGDETTRTGTSSQRKSKNQCSICSKVFKKSYVLMVHMRSHTGERPYICETCGNSFKTGSALSNHKLTHIEKRLSCSHCPYRTTSKNMLKIHDRVHSRIQPYKCSCCGTKFSTNSNMQKHMRNIHAKQRTHQCEHCDRLFFSKESARKHLVTHTGLKPYSCTECSMSYAWYNGLRKHMKALHENAKIPTEKMFVVQFERNVNKKRKAVSQS